MNRILCVVYTELRSTQLVTQQEFRQAGTPERRTRKGRSVNNAVISYILAIRNVWRTNVHIFCVVYAVKTV